MADYVPAPGDTVKSRYAISDKLGHGGFAIVYRGRDTHDGTDIAIKHPRYQRFGGVNDDTHVRDGFQREVALLEKIQRAGGHPDVVRLIDSFTHRGLEFTVVELVDGDVIEEIVDRDPFDADETNQLGVDLCDVMSFIHENEIIYRDLKPDNVMRTARGDLKLIDLNAAALEVEGGSTKLGADQDPWYPIEVKESKYVTNPLPLGPHTDVYSIGKFLFYLLAGHVPRQDAVRPTDFGVDAPAYLNDVIERATRERPDDRYNNAVILKRALEQKDPTPPQQARIRRIQGPGGGARFDVSPGDTLGRKGTSPPPAIPVEDDQQYVSAVQIQFDTDGAGNWFIRDRSTNGTYVNKGDGQGWQLALSSRGYEKQQRQGQNPPTGRPNRLPLDDGDVIALVHPTYGVSFEFHT